MIFPWTGAINLESQNQIRMQTCCDDYLYMDALARGTLIQHHVMHKYPVFAR